MVNVGKYTILWVSGIVNISYIGFFWKSWSKNFKCFYTRHFQQLFNQSPACFNFEQTNCNRNSKLAGAKHPKPIAHLLGPFSRDNSHPWESKGSRQQNHTWFINSIGFLPPQIPTKNPTAGCVTCKDARKHALVWNMDLHRSAVRWHILENQVLGSNRFNLKGRGSIKSIVGI